MDAKGNMALKIVLIRAIYGFFELKCTNWQSHHFAGNRIPSKNFCDLGFSLLTKIPDIYILQHTIKVDC